MPDTLRDIHLSACLICGRLYYKALVCSSLEELPLRRNLVELSQLLPYIAYNERLVDSNHIIGSTVHIRRPYSRTKILQAVMKNPCTAF